MLFSQSWIVMAMAIWLLMIVLTVAVLTLVVRALRHMNREPSLTAITPAQGEFLNAGPVRAARRRMPPASWCWSWVWRSMMRYPRSIG